MKEYIKYVITPYVQQKCKDIKLPSEQTALVMFDVFEGQQTPEVAALLEENNIIVVPIPANCFDRLQSMDLSINKAQRSLTMIASVVLLSHLRIDCNVRY